MNKSKKKKHETLTQKQKIFCEEYIYDWNATRAAKAAGYSEKTAKDIGCQNLAKVYIQKYISDIQNDLEKQAGISRLSQIREFKKIAYSNIAFLHNTWIERTAFKLLTDEQKACIESIDVKVIDGNEQVKVKLYDKQKALENINKMLGYDKIQNETEEEDNDMVCELG